MEVEDRQTQICKFTRVGDKKNSDLGKMCLEGNQKHPDCEDDRELKTSVDTTNNGGSGGGDNDGHGADNSVQLATISRASSGEDRHSKVFTSNGLRDRRVRLSTQTAIRLYDIQDRLGYDQPGKAIEWLTNAAKDSIAELASLPNNHHYSHSNDRNIAKLKSEASKEALEFSMESPPKMATKANNGAQVPSCQVHGCDADLTDCKLYHRRHKVCEFHAKAAKVTIWGKEQRFCQQCSRFHYLGEFDGEKRSCRKLLAGHSRRRLWKSLVPDEFATEDKSSSSSLISSDSKPSSQDKVKQDEVKQKISSHLMISSKLFVYLKITFENEVKHKSKELNRKKDFLLLLSSYPMILMDKDKYKKWIKDVFKINEAVKEAEQRLYNPTETSDLGRYEFRKLSSRILTLLSDPLMENLERILPRDMIEKIYKPIEANEASMEDRKHDQTLHLPEEVFGLAVDFSLRQILENIKRGSSRCIRILGRDDKRLIQAMNNSPEVSSLFAVVFVNVSDKQNNEEILTDIARQLGLTSATGIAPALIRRKLFITLKLTKVLLLLEDCNESIPLVDLGIPMTSHCGVIIFTSKSNQTRMTADTEIRIEDHLLSWELFCRNAGEVVALPSIQKIATRIVRKCRGHLLAITLMARSLKNISDVSFWQLALNAMSSTTSVQEGVDEILATAFTFVWEAMDGRTKHCCRICALYPKEKLIDKLSLISRWVKECVVYSHDEGSYVLQSLTDAFVVEEVKAGCVEVRQEIHDVIVELLLPKMWAVSFDQSDPSLTEPMKEQGCDAKEIYLMESNLSELPESPNCPSLIELYLQRNYDLLKIPCLFFDQMPVLQVLDLSYTSIKSLPKSIPKLVALRKLCLRSCGLFMKLSPEVGELKNLEELDMEETRIIYLPEETGKLEKLKRLRVSFYGYMNFSKKRLQSNTVIPSGVISRLSQLTELSIDVDPDDERWNEVVEAILHEVCSSKTIDTLNLYLPKDELLRACGMDSKSLVCRQFSRFSFLIGHHKRSNASTVPDEVEAHFKEWDKCLKFVNGTDITDEITEILKNATAFYLERHETAKNLSKFGIENMNKLKFCMLTECDEMKTIIGRGEDGWDTEEERSYVEEENSDIEEVVLGSDIEEENSDIEEENSDIEEVVLGSLRILGIYRMNNLQSILNRKIGRWSLSKLTFLAICNCPKLTTIFSVDLLPSLISLKELIVDDCPQITCLVSDAAHHESWFIYLPRLRKISLLFLRNLVSISSGLKIAPELETIGVYCCPKLENLSRKELLSQNLQAIKGQRKWWDGGLKWNESEWGGCRPDHLNSIFHEVDEKRSVRTQFAEDGYFFHTS